MVSLSLPNVFDRSDTNLSISNHRTGRELATLHHICVSYLPDLQVLAKTNNSIKKLVNVSELLTKHKLKYREMIS